MDFFLFFLFPFIFMSLEFNSADRKVRKALSAIEDFLKGNTNVQLNKSYNEFFEEEESGVAFTIQVPEKIFNRLYTALTGNNFPSGVYTQCPIHTLLENENGQKIRAKLCFIFPDTIVGIYEKEIEG